MRHQAEKSVSTRFHSLDALRAWAMLLGIVLHAAWFMTSRNWLAPMTDVDGGYFYDFVMHIIHIFRLQVFFVMAGFFAHLVLARRGTKRFIKHRLARIALPLVLAWSLLYPLMMLQYTRAGLQSGQILSHLDLWETFRAGIAADMALNPTNLMHLWFLYYLLLIYAITLAVLSLMRKVIDRQGTLRRKLDKLFCWCVRSPRGVLLLAALSMIPLCFERMWNGLGGFVFYFVPGLLGLFGYLLFFTFGWFLFLHWEMLETLARHWRRNLALGVALSLPLFAVTLYTDLYATPFYPFLLENSIGDHRQLVTAARTNGTSGQHLAQLRVWESLSTDRQRFLVAHPQLTTDQKTGLGRELSVNVVFNTRFSDPDLWQHVQLPRDLESMIARRARGTNYLTTIKINRSLLEFALPEMILPNFMNRPYARLLKVGFSAGYGLSMWLCVFGIIGAFNRFCGDPSPTSRYIADAAYWIYLIHLPIMMYLETCVGGSRWGFAGAPKFLFYIATTTLLCFASYHYLVRSTPIGLLLNGRRYPFVPLVRRGGRNAVCGRRAD